MVYLLRLSSYCLLLIAILAEVSPVLAETISPVITIDRNNRINQLDQIDRLFSTNANDLANSPSPYVIDSKWQYSKPLGELNNWEDDQTNYFFVQLDNELDGQSQDVNRRKVKLSQVVTNLTRLQN